MRALFTALTFAIFTQTLQPQSEYIDALKNLSDEPLVDLESKILLDNFQVYATRKTIDISKTSGATFSSLGAVEFNAMIMEAATNIESEKENKSKHPYIEANTTKAINKLISFGESTADGSVYISEDSIMEFRREIEANCLWPFCFKD